MKIIAILIFSAMFAFAGCGNTAKVVIHGNQSVGDSWDCTSISPDGVVRKVSNRYRVFFPSPERPEISLLNLEQ